MWVGEPPSGRRWTVRLVALFAGALAYIAIGRWRRAAMFYAVGVALAAAALASVWLGAAISTFVALCAVALLRLFILVDVWRIEPLHPLPRWRVVLLVAVGVVGFYDILGYRIRTQLIEAFQTPSASMYPTLQVGDHFFAKKRSRDFRRGDVVAFRYPLDPATDYVKRIVAVGGDLVSIGLGRLSINGKPIERRQLDQPCIDPANDLSCTLWEETVDGRTWRVAIDDHVPSQDLEPTVVPEGSYFMIGDNRQNSSDSRSWGPVRDELVKGKISFVWWSQDGRRVRWNRLGQPIQ
jgi:signal peptidase I